MKRDWIVASLNKDLGYDDRFVEHLSKAIKIVETWTEWKRQMLSAWDAPRQEQQ